MGHQLQANKIHAIRPVETRLELVQHNLVALVHDLEQEAVTR